MTSVEVKRQLWHYCTIVIANKKAHPNGAGFFHSFQFDNLGTFYHTK